jgi:serine protease
MLALAALPAAPALAADDYAPGQLIARFDGQRFGRAVDLPEGVGVRAGVAALRSNPNVAYAAPNYIATASGLPNDPGTVPPAGGSKSGWAKLQWNFLPCGSLCAPGTAPLEQQSPGGIDAIGAWRNLRKAGRAGGKGVTVAVLDTGVAYKDQGTRFRRSPDFGTKQFVPGYDFVGKDAVPLDANGHGTHITSTIAEKTNNHVGLTGLAYGVKVMPVRVLNGLGNGHADRIAKGIRFAAKHGANIINMSFNFSCGNAVPSVAQAMHFASTRGVLLVGSTGNDEPRSCVTMPAADPHAIAVGGTTEDGCLGSYSKVSPRVDLVAPGGGLPALGCTPSTQDRPIYQLTFRVGLPKQFDIPGDYEGTSMSAAHVSGTAALVIASGVLGPAPTPAQVLARLQLTARDLGAPGHDSSFGAGLINAAAATTP